MKNKIAKHLIMVKSAFVNFWRNGIYIFVAMGIIYLALLLMLITFTKGSISVIKNGLPLYYDMFTEYLQTQIFDLPIESMFSIAFWKKVLSDIQYIFTLGGTTMLNSIAGIGIGCVSFIVLSCVVAQKVCRTLIRRNSSRLESKRGLIAFLFRSVINALCLALFTYLSFLWSYSSIIMIIMYLIFDALAGLIIARFIHFPNIQFRDIVNFNTAINSVLSNIILFICTVLVIFFIASAINMTLGILLAIPVFVYNSAVIDTTGVEYLFALKNKGLLHEVVKKDKISSLAKQDNITPDTDKIAQNIIDNIGENATEIIDD